MNRRGVLERSLPVFGLLVGGCLELRGEPDETGTDGPGDGTETNTDTPPNDQEDDDMGSDLDTRFAVIDVRRTGVEDAATVTAEDRTVTVTGTIQGFNTCYTARLGAVRMEDRTLLVGIESYEDAAEGEGCRDSIVGIEYEVVVELGGASPDSIRVEHNGEVVTTDHRS